MNYNKAPLVFPGGDASAALRQPVGQAFTFQIFHYQKVHSILPADIKQGADIASPTCRLSASSCLEAKQPREQI